MYFNVGAKKKEHLVYLICEFLVKDKTYEFNFLLAH
jgi:hypothetical protein